MFETRRQVRRAVLAVTLALALGVAGSALAGPALESGGWWTSGLESVVNWWGALWGAPEPAREASQSAPADDPDSISTQTNNLDDAAPLTDGEPEGESEAYPNLDPDG